MRDPRRKGIEAALEILRVNPMIRNSNSLLDPLYHEVLRLREDNERLLSQLKELNSQYEQLESCKAAVDPEWLDHVNEVLNEDNDETSLPSE